LQHALKRGFVLIQNQGNFLNVKLQVICRCLSCTNLEYHAELLIGVFIAKIWIIPCVPFVIMGRYTLLKSSFSTLFILWELRSGPQALFPIDSDWRYYQCDDAWLFISFN
jgi:hypothetical protein